MGADDTEKGVTEPLTSQNSVSNVKFTNNDVNKSLDAKVDVTATSDTIACGLSKEELLKFANDPTWKRIRMVFFIMFWVIWFSMFFGAIIIIATAPRCPATANVAWYQRRPMYHIWVRSFVDSNNDTHGDLPGVTTKVPYLKNELDIGTVILSPIFAKSNDSGSISIIDFKTVDPVFGTLQDFEILARDLQTNDMKLILDINVTATSVSHPWFVDALNNNNSQYRDYYIWSSTHNSSLKGIWLWEPKVGAWYLKRDDELDSASLNLSNEKVQNEIKSIFKYWLNLGANGFRLLNLDKVNRSVSFMGADDADLDLLEDWRQYIRKIDPKAVLIASIDRDEKNLGRFFTSPDRRSLDLLISQGLARNNSWSQATELKQHITDIMDSLGTWPRSSRPIGPWIGWSTGGPNTQRLALRSGVGREAGFYLITNLLGKGVPIIYFGDEMGIEQASLTELIWQDHDRKERLNKNTPFSVPGDDNIHTVAKDIARIRKENIETVLIGETRFPVTTEDLFSLVRFHPGSKGLLLLFNLGSMPASVQIKNYPNTEIIPDAGDILISTSRLTHHRKGSTVDFTDVIRVQSKEALVIEFASITPE